MSHPFIDDEPVKEKINLRDSLGMYVKNTEKKEDGEGKKTTKQLQIPKRKVEEFKIYDKVHGIMKLPMACKKIFESSFFTRLADISQLSIIKYIIPTADHSRFEHSRGTSHFAYIAALRQHSIDPENIPYLHVIVVAIAGACHDLGHCLFSHAYDVLVAKHKLEGPQKHEYRSMYLFACMMIDELHSDPLFSEFGKAEIALVQYFIDPEKYEKYIDPNLEKLPKFKKGLEQIVNNYVHKLDVDKMDYILRDSLHMKVDCEVNKKNIISMLNRANIIDGKWVFDIRDRNTVERLLHHRYILYANYYMGNRSIGMGAMLIDILSDVQKTIDIVSCASLKTDKDVKMFCSLKDDYIFEQVLNSNDPVLKNARKLIGNIMENKNCYSVSSDVIYRDLQPNVEIQYIPATIFNDKSNPIEALKKIIYHTGGIIVDHNNIQLLREINTKKRLSNL